MGNGYVVGGAYAAELIVKTARDITPGVRLSHNLLSSGDHNPARCRLPLTDGNCKAS